MLRELMIKLSWISPIILFIGILGIFFRWKTFGLFEWTISFFLLIFCIIDFCSRYILEWFNLESNLLLLSIYTVIEYLFLSILYTQFFPTKGERKLQLIAISGGILILITFFSKLAPLNVLMFQLYDGLIANLFSLLFGLFFIYKILAEGMKSTKQQRLLNSIIIMYSGIQLFMALTINFMVNMDVELVFFFWLIRLIALSIFYLKLAQIIWQTGKKVVQ